MPLHKLAENDIAALTTVWTLGGHGYLSADRAALNMHRLETRSLARYC